MSWRERKKLKSKIHQKHKKKITKEWWNMRTDKNTNGLKKFIKYIYFRFIRSQNHVFHFKPSYGKANILLTEWMKTKQMQNKIFCAKTHTHTHFTYCKHFMRKLWSNIHSFSYGHKRYFEMNCLLISTTIEIVCSIYSYAYKALIQTSATQWILPFDFDILKCAIKAIHTVEIQPRAQQSQKWTNSETTTTFTTFIETKNE